MGVACVKYGFCGSADHASFDTKRGAWTAEAFAFEVLRAEGMDPLMIEGIGPSQSEYFKMIRDLFVKQCGATIRRY